MAGRVTAMVCARRAYESLCAAAQFKKDHELLAEAGAVGSSPETLLYALIDKMPPSMVKEAADLRTKISDAQILKQPLLTYEQLTALVAGKVHAAVKPETNAAFVGTNVASSATSLAATLPCARPAAPSAV